MAKIMMSPPPWYQRPVNSIKSGEGTVRQIERKWHEPPRSLSMKDLIRLLEKQKTVPPKDSYININDKYFKKFTMSKLDKTISAMVGNGAAELTIRQGEALPVANKKTVVIKGNIDAPSRFVAARDIDKKTSHCFYSVSMGHILLVVDESEPYGGFEVDGRLMPSRKYKELGINSGEALAPLQLANKLKMLRSLFPSRDEHAKICNSLRKFEATVKKVLEEHVEDNGSYNYSRQQAVDSNLPEAFQMHIPLIEGEPKQTIVVNTIITVHGNDTRCSLESVEAAEYIEEAFENRVLEETKKLDKHTTLIAR